MTAGSFATNGSLEAGSGALSVTPSAVSIGVPLTALSVVAVGVQCDDVSCRTVETGALETGSLNADSIVADSAQIQSLRAAAVHQHQGTADGASGAAARNGE